MGRRHRGVVLPELHLHRAGELPGALPRRPRLLARRGAAGALRAGRRGRGAHAGRRHPEGVRHRVHLPHRPHLAAGDRARCSWSAAGGWAATSASSSGAQPAARREAERAQLLALRAHLDPHFLFNTLNAIAEWCREDGAVAEAAVLQLVRDAAHGARRGEGADAGRSSRSSSWCDTLFALHLLRDPALFTLERAVPSPLPAVQVPPLLAAAARRERDEARARRRPPRRGAPRARARRRGELRVVLENPGAYRGPRAGSDGLPTLRSALALAYGGDAPRSRRRGRRRRIARRADPASSPPGGRR